MTDIVERLRGPHEWGYRDLADGTFIPDNTPFQAADEIERLRAALDEYGDHKFDCEMKDTWQCSCGYTAVLRKAP